jgi:hypothetical protein
MTTLEMEYYIARHFDWRRHIIVPNISYGLGLHECDLLIFTRAGYATEVEIKISLSDLKKDAKKEHKHGIDYVGWSGIKEEDRIKYLYFAIPEKLEKHADLIPGQAGIFVIKGDCPVQMLRHAQAKSRYCFTKDEMYNIARLGTMRIWTYKSKIIELKNKLKEKTNEHLLLSKPNN